MGYFGSKATSGLCQPLIAMIPPHDTYIETHLGGGAIMKRKPAALRNIGIDRDARALDAFECDYPVELVHGCAHRYLAEFEFQGSELVYSDPPYLKRTRTSRRRYRFDYEEADHVALLELLKGVPCQVMVSGYPSTLYEERLGGWRSVEWQVMNQDGVRTEKLWFNFAPERLHWARYAGKNFTDRQRIKRKAQSWGRPGPLQYGPGVKAYVVHLLIAQMLSLKRVAHSMHALIGQLLSEATLLSYIAQLHHALAEWERQAIERLLAQPAMHVDETSLRVDRKNHWIHVYSAATLTVKRLHPKRGCEAIEDIGIIPRYGGVAVHDCWASYLSYTHCDHALCGSHLLRELTFIVEAHDYAWAKRMKRLLLHACHEVAKRDEKTLSESEYKAVQKRYRTILTQGERELPPIPPRQKGQRGKVAKSDAHNLWERMKKYEKAVLRFAKHPDVAFTNNRAERDLRMSKVKQKVSGCFRTRKYAEAYCRISSYLQSMANQGYNPLVAIQIALAGRAVDNLPE